MIIEINDKCRINFDGNNYVPEIFDQGGKEITIGKSKGEISKSKWKSTNKNFGSVDACVRFLTVELTTMRVDDEMGGSISLSQYLDEIKTVKDELVNAIESNR